jgi:hypothetical protein
MPLIFLLIFLTILVCMWHAHQTGRPNYWFYILLLLPGPGVLAYLLFELLPEWLGTGRRAQSPSKVPPVGLPPPDFEQRNFDERLAAAESHLAHGEPERAARVLEGAMAGWRGSDPKLLLMLARARFALREPEEARRLLEKLRDTNPDFQSPEGHLLYARSLERSDPERAEFEYVALVQYFPGQEARARYAAFLEARGKGGNARDEWERIVTNVERAPAYVAEEQREWYELAKMKVAEK